MVSHGTPDHVHVALEFETTTMTQMSSLDDKLQHRLGPASGFNDA